MAKIIPIAGGFLLGFYWVIGVPFVQAEQIQSFESKAEIQKDRSLQVQETIQYDFEDNSRQGIYRVIPRTGIKGFEEISALHNGDPVEMVIEDTSPLTLRLGTEGMYITGVHRYQISYTMQEAVQRFGWQSQDELYWNITGNDWEVPIKNLNTQIVLPSGIQESDITGVSCYQGAYGSDTTCEYDLDIQKSLLTITTELLPPGEGITIAIGFVPGILDQPGLIARYQHILDLILGIIILGGALGGSWWWFTRYGRDPILPPTVVRQYTPPEGFRAPEVGRIYEYYAKSQHISALIIDLARRGFFRIEDVSGKWKGKEYIFHQQETSLDKLQRYEAWIMKKMFRNRTSVSTKVLQKEEFGKHIVKLQDKIYQESLTGVFAHRPGVLVGVGVIIGITGVILGSWALLATWYATGIGLLIGAGAFLMVAPFMSKRTERGAELYQYIKGFRYYLTHAEVERLKFQEAEVLFFELLPYAIALGVVKQWTKAFESVHLTKPDWYQSTNNTFIPYVFATDLGQGMNAFVTHAGGAASSGSSGGGFSGGGVGGGGGGSW